MDHLTKGKTCIGNCTFFKLENIKQLLGLGPGNSREFPEKILSRSFPGIFSISREISGNFYILSSQKFLDFTNFGIFSY